MVDNQTMEESGPDKYDEVVITKNTETVDAFSSHVIPTKAEKAYMGEYIEHRELKMALYYRVSPFKMHTQS